MCDEGDDPRWDSLAAVHPGVQAPPAAGAGPGHPVAGFPQQLYPLVQAYVGIPYVWGGTDPKAGLDFSSFTQWIYAHLGW